MLFEFWQALDFTSSTFNALLAIFCTLFGYWMSVAWSREQDKITKGEQRESLFKSLELFICDCLFSIGESRGELLRRQPAHRPIPVSGIEYFQVELMRFEEVEILGDVSSLRYLIEQSKQLESKILDLFVENPALSVGGGDQEKAETLKNFCEETVKRHDDLNKKCHEIIERIKQARVDNQISKQKVRGKLKWRIMKKHKWIRFWVKNTIMPLALVFIAWMFNSSLKTKEIDAILVNAAVDVLSSEATEENLIMRGWGVDVIQAKSDVKFSKKQESGLRNGKYQFPRSHVFEGRSYVEKFKDGSESVKKDLSLEESLKIIRELTNEAGENEAL